MKPLNKYLDEIIFLGMNKRRGSMEVRQILTTNQINLTLMIFALIFINIIAFGNLLKGEPLRIGFWRMVLILVMTIVNIFFLRKGYYFLVKNLLVFCTIFIIIILPSLFGLVLEEFYFIYPYSIVGFSLIPAIILSHQKEFRLYIISLVYYLLLVFFSDNLLTLFSPDKLKTGEIIKSFYVMYKVYPIVFFFFLHFVIYRIRILNFNYETQLKSRNKKILKSKDNINSLYNEILSQKDEIEAQRDSIQQQRDLITKQNDGLKESIVYAGRIQKAVLPSEEMMENIMPSHFVFYKPRDEVSGDFFWVDKKGDNIIVTLADCTGHGVPGAFMSLLGISIIKNIILKSDECRPDEMMESLRSTIFSSFKKKGVRDDTKIGMDIGIIVLNTKTRVLQFTGSQHNLYLFNNLEFIEIKGDRMALDLHFYETKLYTLHSLVLNTGDTLYLSSDGFPDQFGGKKRKKYGYRRFRDFLTDLQFMSMQQQFTALSKEFYSWKSNEEQTDDVIVIGIRCP